MHDYDKIAAIVGEDKINALREAGVEITDKPSKPTTDLLGRWAKTPDGKDVLIISESVKDNGRVWVAFHTDDEEDGAATIDYCLSSLTFPEETTRPEDVPVGEAWLVNIGERTISAVKTLANNWYSGELRFVSNEYVTLIAPLVPARPVENKPKKSYWSMQAEADKIVRECWSGIEKRFDEEAPETVTTEEEYKALPDGSIVAAQSGAPYCRERSTWFCADMPFSHRYMAGVTRTVLRKGRGE